MNQLTVLAHALSDPTRVRLLVACLERERCVCQLVELIDLSNASISKHLGVLKRTGLMDSRKEGRWVHYRVPDAPDELIGDALELVRSHALDDAGIEADRVRLGEIDAIDPCDLARMQRQGCCVPVITQQQGEHDEHQR